jgi:hypothetical protein
MIARIKLLISAIGRVPLICAGVCLPGLAFMLVEVAKRATIGSPELPPGIKPPAHWTTGLVGILVLSSLQIIPWLHFRRYKELSETAHDQPVFGLLSLRTGFILECILYFGAALASVIAF